MTERILSKAKRGRFYTYCKIAGVPTATIQNGWLWTETSTGYRFGAYRASGRWRICELSTGLSIDTKDCYKIVFSEFPGYILSIFDIAVDIIKKHPEYVFEFSEAVNAAKRKEREENESNS